jgi:hypothetical protein
MIDKKEIMKQIEHMETNTPEQREERVKEAFRLIKEREDENTRLIEEKHEACMMKLHEKARLSQEKHDLYMMCIKIQIQETIACTPKRQIYFGKVKTE